MTNSLPPRQRKEFETAIICTLRSEADAWRLLFDKFWEDDGEEYGKAPGEPNADTTALQEGLVVTMLGLGLCQARARAMRQA